MKKQATFLTVITLLLSAFCYGQYWLGADREAIQKHFENHAKKNHYNMVVKETDSTLSFMIRDTSIQTVDFVFELDNEGKADRQTVSNCDSCFHQMLKDILEDKRLGWIKIGDGFYLSKFLRKMILEIDRKKLSYRISRLKWNRKQYQDLLSVKTKPDTNVKKNVFSEEDKKLLRQ